MKRLIAFLLTLFTVVLAGAQDPSKNYILSKRMLNSGGTSHVNQVTYYDGIGRPVQTLTKAVQGGSVKKRMASLTEYDGTGRPVSQWLPVPVTADYTAAATLKSTATGAGGYGDSRPYVQTVYEQSPLDRAIGSYGPGAAWSEHGVTTAYLSNTASGVQSCKLYAATSTVLTGGSSNYAAGTLQVVKTTDEDGHVSYTFTDRLGRTLLTRQMNGDTQHDTYYVYDPAGNLRYVLQPEYQTTADLAKYAFQYQYDTYNRCVRKTLPGASYVAYEYDTKDRLVFSQETGLCSLRTGTNGDGASGRTTSMTTTAV